MVLQWNSVKEIKGESDICTYIRKEEIFYHQTHTHACMHRQERERCFNETYYCTIARPMEILQYWNVPWQTQRMTTPSFVKEWRLQYNHWRKGSCLESTTFKQNWSKHLERMYSLVSPQFAIRSGGLENGQQPWTQSLVITLPKKSNLQQCQNYRTISLISHPSKVMLKVILNRLKPQAEKIIALCWLWHHWRWHYPGKWTVPMHWGWCHRCWSEENCRLLMEEAGAMIQSSSGW